MGEVLDLTFVRNQLFSQVERERKKIKKRIALSSFCIGEDASSLLYISIQKKLAQKLDVEYRLYSFSSGVRLTKIVKVLTSLNGDSAVGGIIIHRPLPKKFSEAKIFSLVSPYKDIEGITPYNLGRTMLGKPVFIPPTVLSILKILEELRIELYGKDVVLVGFSPHIGKPLSVLLLDKLATLSITHIATYKRKRLPFYLKRADIVISSVGRAKFLKKEWIKKGAVVIDVGISSLKGKICGDVDIENVKKKASFITPVPGGVGSLTPLYLFLNLFKAYKLREDEFSAETGKQ
ncbi:MAG: hypothetical protein B6D55_00115 [Candidatus Omnitrophica bacterium 4484_70.2]|nr:MAG: hypothetical protein B6D55_00115 [Candidatus Omnitrophica bacterium 4484_70.2]